MSFYPNNPLTLGQATFNPYIPQPIYNTVPTTPVVPPQGPRMQIDSVNGKESALAYLMGPNSSVILADTMKPKIWIVTTDSSGYKAVKGFKITPDEEDEIPVSGSVSTDVSDRYEELETRLQKLEERMNHLGQSNTKSSWQNKSGNANAQSNDRYGAGSKGSNGGDQPNVGQ